MTLTLWLTYLSASLPLTAALRANRRTSLIHSVAWAAVAWLAWGVALATSDRTWAYVALGLTGCAGVAVLGARRPGAAAWNFIVASLLVVLLLPLAEGALIGTPLRLGTFRTLFLTVLVSVTVMNYLPTRLAAGAVLLGIGSA